jgi:hypothetical protein
VHSRAVSGDTSLPRRRAIRYVERQAACLGRALPRLTQHEGAIVRLERSVFDGELTKLVIADVNLDRLQAEPSGVTGLERLKHNQRSSRLPRRGAHEVRVTRHVSES